MKRRDFLAASAAFGGSLVLPRVGKSAEPERKDALVAITLDLEMSANIPR